MFPALRDDADSRFVVAVAVYRHRHARQCSGTVGRGHLRLEQSVVSSLYGLEASANVMTIQGVFVPIQRHFFLDHIVRATMPVVTTPVSDAEYASGFGDFNVFDAFKLSKPEAKTEFGAG